MEAIILAGLELVAEVIRQIELAQHSKDADHADIMSRVEASRAALAGAKSEAHAAVEKALADAQAAINKALGK
jgi:hypothetical protein